MESQRKPPFETFIFKSVVWFFSLKMERGGGDLFKRILYLCTFPKSTDHLLKATPALPTLSPLSDNQSIREHPSSTNICTELQQSLGFSTDMRSIHKSWGVFCYVSVVIIHATSRRHASETQVIQWSHELPNSSVTPWCSIALAKNIENAQYKALADLKMPSKVPSGAPRSRFLWNKCRTSYAMYSSDLHRMTHLLWTVFNTWNVNFRFLPWADGWYNVCTEVALLVKKKPAIEKKEKLFL